jgi:DNA-binding SARP family transcriptional activator
VRALTALAATQEGQGAYAAALATIDRALAFDPLQEDLQRAALRLSYLAGDRTGAIRRYAHLRHLLDEEMGVLPMPERAPSRRLLADTRTGASGEALTPHLRRPCRSRLPPRRRA